MRELRSRTRYRDPSALSQENPKLLLSVVLTGSKAGNKAARRSKLLWVLVQGWRTPKVDMLAIGSRFAQ